MLMPFLVSTEKLHQCLGQDQGYLLLTPTRFPRAGVRQTPEDRAQQCELEDF